VLHSVSKLVFNLDPTHSTEVIGLFDVELFASGVVGARSLHLFSAAVPVEEPIEADTGEATRPLPRRSSGTWLVAAALSAAVAGLGTAYYLQRIRPKPLASAGAAAQWPSLTVTVEPAAAEITLDGARIDPGVAVPVPSAGVDHELRVACPGFRPWSRTLLPGQFSGDERIYVRLDREP
jgi:hypothetical protein